MSPQQEVIDSGYRDLTSGQALLRLAKQVGVYGFGTALQRISGFLLIPLYIWKLSPEEYGLFGLVAVLPVVLSPVVLLGMPSAITRYYHEWARDGLAARNLGMIWVIATGSSLTAIFLLDQFGGVPLGYILTQVPFTPHIRLGLWWTFFAGLSVCPLLLLRIREQSRAYVAVSQASFLLKVGLTAWVVLAGWGVVGILWAQIVSSACIGMILTIWYLRQSVFRLHTPSIVRALRFSLPLIPSGLLEVVAYRADRFFLDKWVPLPEIGLYEAANQIAQGVKVFYDSVKPAWIPFYIRVADERKDARKFLGEAVTLYIASLGFVALAILFFSPNVVSWISGGGAYTSALPLLPILIGGYVFHGLAPVGSMAILVAEQTRWQPIIVLGEITAVIVTNLLLTPRFGVAGAAWSFLLSMSVLALLQLIVGQGVYSVKLEWTRLRILLAAGLVYGSAGIAFPSTWIAIKVLLLLSFGLVMAAAGFCRRRVIRTVPKAVTTGDGRSG